MQDKGITKEELQAELDQIKALDMEYESGRIISSMCTQPHPIAKEVFNQFFESNLGDPGLFKGTSATEKKVIKQLGQLLHLEKSYGTMVTGGTEANLMAMRAARNMARLDKGITHPEIIVPPTAHFSFKKAEDILGLKIIESDVDENYRINTETLEEKITPNTVAIVAIAGTTELGRIDPIEEIGKIASKHNIYLHVDAAFGGFIIPFLDDYDFPEFDFKINAVSSITLDPHKMGLAPIPAGCIIFRDKKSLDSMDVDTPYLTCKNQATIVGTRSGATVMATYALLRYLGREGYREIAHEAMQNTFFFADELQKLGFQLSSKVKLNIVSFSHPKIPLNTLQEELTKRGWAPSVSKYPKSIRIVIMPHIKREHIIDLINDLKEIIG